MVLVFFLNRHSLKKMNTILLLIFSSSFIAPKPDTTLKPVINEVAKLQRYLLPPPEYFNPDTCFRYSGLLVLEIGKSGKVNGFNLNDYAPAWLKKDLDNRKQNGQINFRRMDSLTIKSGVKNCKLVFPLTLESDNFPCSKLEAKKDVETNFYKINNRNLSGNLLFMDPLVFTWSTNFRH